MAATSPLRPSTPSSTPLNAYPRLSPKRITPAFPPQASYISGHRNLNVFSPVDQNGSFCFDRVIKSGKVHRRVKKKGAWKPSWKSGYLVLRPNLLSIYQNEDETDLKASITLSEVTAVAPVRKAHTDNVFGVFSPSKNYHFQGTSLADTADWIALIRTEARTDEDDDVDLAAPFLPSNVEAANIYDSTDISADELPHAPGSSDPSLVQAPNRPRTRSQLARQQRRPSTLQEYSGNEQFTTSHSDFSDVLGSSLPKNTGSQLSHPPALSPITSSPQIGGAADANTPPQLSASAPPGDPTTDPERVICHGHLQILKSYKTGVKGWKTIWLVLRARSLSFYKNDNEYAAVKVLAMESIIDAAETDPISRTKNYCFQIITDDKTLRFCAANEDDLAKWLGSLKSVLNRRREAGKPLTKSSERGLVEATAALSFR